MLMKKIDEKTAELVELFKEERKHNILSTVNTTGTNQGAFIGYATSQIPDERSYHFLAGNVSEIHPNLVKLLSAVYDTEPLQIGGGIKPKIFKKVNDTEDKPKLQIKKL